LIDAVTGAIENRTVGKQQDPTGARLAPLKQRTKDRKARLGLDPRILIETHEMLGFEQIRGEVVITSNTASMTAGLDDETRLKVEYAHEGSPNRAKREFMDLGNDGEKAQDEWADETIDQSVADAYSA